MQHRLILICLLISAITVSSSVPSSINSMQLGAQQDPNPDLSIFSIFILEKTVPISSAKEAERVKPGSPQFLFFLISALILMTIAGFMSGLTVGYLSIDPLVIEMKMKTGNEKERKQVSHKSSIG